MPIDVATIAIIDNELKSQYEMHLDGKVAALEYTRSEERTVLTQTVMPQALDGRGLAARLAKFALDDARTRGTLIVPKCVFVGSFIARHREYADLVEPKAPYVAKKK